MDTPTVCTLSQNDEKHNYTSLPVLHGIIKEKASTLLPIT